MHQCAARSHMSWSPRQNESELWARQCLVVNAERTPPAWSQLCLIMIKLEAELNTARHACSPDAEISFPVAAYPSPSNHSSKHSFNWHINSLFGQCNGDLAQGMGLHSACAPCKSTIQLTLAMGTCTVYCVWTLLERRRTATNTWW